MVDVKKTSRLDEFIANPRGALWRLGLPILAGMSVQTLYMLVDMYFVGRVSSQALAALAFNMPLIFLGIGVIFGLGSGVTSVIARSIGAGDKRLADSSAEHAVALGVALSAVATLAAYAWGRRLLAALGVPEHLMPLASGVSQDFGLGIRLSRDVGFLPLDLVGRGRRENASDHPR